MIETLKNLANHSFIYGMGEVLNLLPIHTCCLTPADYGILSLLGVTGAIGVIITAMGINNSMFREVLYRGSDEREVQNTSLDFILLGSSIIYGPPILLSPHLSCEGGG